jgi:hypothetical protein
MTNPIPLPVIKTKDKTLVLQTNWSSENSPYRRYAATPTDVKYFKKWLRRHGFTSKPTYPYRYHMWQEKRHRTGESERRMSTWTGTGVYADVTIMITNRVALPKDSPTRYRNRGGLDGRGHGRGDNSIIVDTDISCFYHDQNLLGWWGISWQDIMAGDLPLLLKLRTPSLDGHARYVLGKAA